MKPIKVLMVCLGNICRSPTAEGIFQDRVQKSGLSDVIEVDSAGTSDWHLGKAPDVRSQRAALKRGYDLSDLAGRQVTVQDFDQFDYILAMDDSNLNDLRKLSPPNFKGHLGLFLDFCKTNKCREVPDPYHGGSEGFVEVLDLVEDASDGLLAHIKQHHSLA